MPATTAENNLPTAHSVRQRRTSILLCFFLSGAVCLIYQIVWQRMILRDFGATLPAVSLTIACIMAGFAGGSALAGRLLPRIVNPLQVYAGLEGAIALCAFVSPWFLDPSAQSFFTLAITSIGHSTGLMANSIFDGNFWLRAGLVCLIVSLPSVLMGATFPIVGAVLSRQSPGDASPYVPAYAWNLLGAALGSLLCAFLLLPNLGLLSGLMVAAVVNLIVVFYLLFMMVQTNRSATQPNTDSWLTPQSSETKCGGNFLFVCYGIVVLVGFLGMSLEVLWTRLSCLIFGSSTYAIGSVLFAHLLGLALGAAVAAYWRSSASLQKVALLFLAFSAWLFFDLHLIVRLPWLLSVAQEGSPSFQSYLAERIGFVFLLVCLPAAITGGVLPLVLKQTPGRHAPWLYSANCLGAVAGALCTGLYLITVFGRWFASGMESTLIMLSLLSLAGAAVVVCTWEAGKSKIRYISLAILLAAVTLLGRPQWSQALLSSGASFLSLPAKASATETAFARLFSDSSANRLLFYREGLNSTVSVSENVAAGIVYLKNDGKVEAALCRPGGTRAASTHGYSDLPTHVLLGQMPALMHAGKAERVFVAGFGSGATCGAVRQDPETTSLTVAEIEPAVLEAEKLFQPMNFAPLSKNGISICLEDARVLLRFNDTKYDIIISQPGEPWLSGSADLYSREFWQLGRSRLNENGVFCQWIQLYSIDEESLTVLTRTFQSVFPDTYIVHFPAAGELILIGTTGASGAANIEANHRRLGSSLAALRDLMPPGLAPNDCIVIKPDQLRRICSRSMANLANGSGRLNTDDNLFSEYTVPRHLYSFGNSIENNLHAFAIVQKQ